MDKLNLSFATGFVASLSNELLIFDLTIKANFELDEELEYFTIGLRNLYAIDDLKNYVNGSGNLKLPTETLTVFASLAYSSARGILKEKLAATRFGSHFLLPVIDPNILTKKLNLKKIPLIE